MIVRVHRCVERLDARLLNHQTRRINAARKETNMVASLVGLLAQAPAVHPSNPPGYDRVTTLVDWTAKLAITACVVGIIVTAGMLAVQHHRGTLGPDTGGRLGVVLGSCVLIGVASQLVNSLV